MVGEGALLRSICLGRCGPQVADWGCILQRRLSNKTDLVNPEVVANLTE